MDRAAHRLRQGAADAVMHFCAGTRRACVGHRKRRRGYFTILYFCIDGERVRVAGRSTSLCGHPGRHTQSRRTADRSGDYEIIREKGTDRGRFFRGEVDKYVWQDVGSSFLPNEITAAFLWAQLEEAERITRERLAIWQRYHERLAGLEQQGLLRRPIVPADCRHNGHMYYILLQSATARHAVLDGLKPV